MAVAVVGTFAVTPVVAGPPTAGAVAALGGAHSATVVPTPNAGPGLPSYLTGVSSVSESWCVAAGASGTTSVSRTLALVLRGPDPTPPPPAPRFTG